MTQEQAILNHLQSGKTISPLEALNFYGCFRLAAVIHRLREEHDILSEDGECNGKHFAVYRYVRAIIGGHKAAAQQEMFSRDPQSLNL